MAASTVAEAVARVDGTSVTNSVIMFVLMISCCCCTNDDALLPTSEEGGANANAVGDEKAMAAASAAATTESLAMVWDVMLCPRHCWDFLGKVICARLCGQGWCADVISGCSSNSYKDPPSTWI